MKVAHLAFLFVVTSPLFAQLSEGQTRQFEEAGRRIVRLPPSAFPELPGKVVLELQRRACTIPQAALTKKRDNVIRGQFEKTGEWDWAVLCSVKGVSTILVFRDGSGYRPSEIAVSQDRNFLQGITDTRIGYSREINTVGRKIILDHYAAYGGSKPPLIDHQGIDDAFLEKASVTWYFYRGKWLQLTGSD